MYGEDEEEEEEEGGAVKTLVRIRRRVIIRKVIKRKKNINYYIHTTNNISECAYCLDTFVKGDRKMQLPCLHEFHANKQDCRVLQWWNTKKTCPVCRSVKRIE
jgi:hypothetical protein